MFFNSNLKSCKYFQILKFSKSFDVYINARVSKNTPDVHKNTFNVVQTLNIQKKYH